NGTRGLNAVIQRKSKCATKHLMVYSLYDLSRWLKDYHRQRCIILVDEYDHPLDIAGASHTATIKKLIGHLSESIREQLSELLLKGAITVKIIDDIDYKQLSSQHAYRTFWAFLYYTGYVTMDTNK
ncbi:4980_t:CDS:2, partial [Racocetra persica]